MVRSDCPTLCSPNHRLLRNQVLPPAAKVDRYLDQVREGRFGRGNGCTTFVFKFMRKGKERRSMTEDYSRKGIGAAKGQVLTLDELKDRVPK